MNTYWKIKTCLADKSKGSILIRIRPEMEFFDLDQWGSGYWERRLKNGTLRNKFWTDR